MPYDEDTYGDIVMGLEGADWYKVTELGKAINFCTTINFSVVTAREDARKMIADLVRECPYSLTRQFPKAAFVCANKGDWPRKFTQVLEALCFKETTENPGATGVNQARAASQQPAPLQWDYNMAERAYFTGLEEMRAEIGRFDRLFTRNNFEKEFGLVWNA